jgi:hypothetical protein
MSFALTYEAPQHGWTVEMTVSYLHDSLYDLTTAASALVRGATQATVVFMDEPGEHQLLLRQPGPDRVDFELRWFDHWASWGHSPEEFRTLLVGSTTAASFARAVLAVLDTLWSELEPAEYKERWVQHEFPVERYKKLKALVAA